MKSNEDKEIDKKRENEEIIQNAANSDYKYGFITDIDMHVIPKGLNEDVVRYISKVKNEPEWMLEFRLEAFRYWLTLEMPTWAHLDIPEIDYQDISYYAAPKQKEGPKSLDEVDPECDLNYTPNKPVKADLTIAMSDSLGFGGHNSCVVFRKYIG